MPSTIVLNADPDVCPAMGTWISNNTQLGVIADPGPHSGANIWIGIQDNGGGHGSALEMLSACVLVVCLFFWVG